MSYLTSHFITLSKLSLLEGQNPNFLYQPIKALTKETKKPLYPLKTIKQDQFIPLGKQTKAKTKPLILFVNLLMKNGKKSHALRVLSTTLSLFKARISKMKLEKHVGSLKESKQSFYQFFFRAFKVPGIAWPLQSLSFASKGYALQEKQAFAENEARQRFLPASKKPHYKMSPNNCYILFSRKKSIGPATSKTFSNSVFFLLVKYKKVFPFISGFLRLFDDFYLEKKFFCGKFVHLRPLQTNEKSKQFLSLFGKGNAIRKTFFKKEKTNLLKNYKTLREVRKQRDKALLLEKSQSTKSQFPKSLWYKALLRKCSWDKLTSFQKSSFLYCLFKAISNVKPPLECRTKRIGGSNKQIPSQVAEHRQWRIAIRWIIEAAQNEFSKKKNKTTVLDKEVYKTDFYDTLETFENSQDNSKIVRGVLCKAFLQKTNYSSIGQELPALDSLYGNSNYSSSDTKAKKLATKQPTVKKKTAPKGCEANALPRQSIGKASKTYVLQAKERIGQGNGLFGPQSLSGSQRTMAKSSKSILYMPCNLESWVIKQKKNYISSLFQKSPKTGKLKPHFKKTKFDSFCFFLAESLENAYYKKGPAMQKRNLWIETALTNRAFLRYRWW